MSGLKTRETPRDAAFRKSVESGAPVYNSLRRRVEIERGCVGDRNAVEAPEKPKPTTKPRPPINPKSKKAKAREKQEEAWRATFHARSNGVCEWCDSARSQHAHHLYEVSRYGELRLHPANGLAVCLDCHDLAHEDLLYTRAWFAKLIPAFGELYAETGEIKERNV